MTQQYSDVKLKVRAGASRDKIDGWLDVSGDRILKISIKQIPEEGKANKAIIRFLAKELKIPQKHLEIIKGQTSSYKTLRLKVNSPLIYS